MMRTGIKGRPYSDLTDRELNTVKESVERLLRRNPDAKAKTVLREIWDELTCEKAERIAGEDPIDFSSDFDLNTGTKTYSKTEEKAEVTTEEVTEIRVKRSVGLRRSKKLLDRKGKQ